MPSSNELPLRGAVRRAYPRSQTHRSCTSLESAAVRSPDKPKGRSLETIPLDRAGPRLHHIQRLVEALQQSTGVVGQTLGGFWDPAPLSWYDLHLSEKGQVMLTLFCYKKPSKGSPFEGAVSQFHQQHYPNGPVSSQRSYLHVWALCKTWSQGSVGNTSHDAR